MTFWRSSTRTTAFDDSFGAMLLRTKDAPAFCWRALHNAELEDGNSE
jgi:hypothetical protein